MWVLNQATKTILAKFSYLKKFWNRKLETQKNTWINLVT